ncbi:LysE family translocator [Actinoplanes sp. NPDC051861]|uniref:LysE family translocator n=1 Tax=Actinoplanes sp. NPDC051861 TaxID=3155170 RepID=UPI003422095F
MPVHIGVFVATTWMLAMLPGAGQALVVRQTLEGGRRRAWAAIAGTCSGLVIWTTAAAAGLSAVLLANPNAYTLLRIAGGLLLAGLGVSTLRSLRADGRRQRIGGDTPRQDEGSRLSEVDDEGNRLSEVDDEGNRLSQVEDEGSRLSQVEGDRLEGGRREWEDGWPARSVGDGVRWERERRRAYVAGLATNLGNPKAGVFAVSLLPQFVSADGPVLVSSVALGVLWAVVTGTWYVVFTWLVDRGRALVARPATHRRLQVVTGCTLLCLGAAVAAGV